MRLGRYFIDRPVFAIALSIATLIIGAVAASRLPVSQYPEVVPPTVTVTAQYPGATATTIADTVATPIEQEVNGVDDMIYMQSQATQDGRLTLTVTFRIGTDLDKAQVLVQNRVALAEPRLPEVVRRIGVSVTKNSPDFLLVVQLISDDGSRDQLYLSNYATQHVVPVLNRLPGVGSVQVIGAREYAMRVWLNPDQVAELGLSAAEVVDALRSQNVQVAGGILGQPPLPMDRAFQPSITVQGRFVTPAEFEQIIVKRTADGRVVRVKDVGRVELGARDYGTNAYTNDTPVVALLVFQRPGTNALQTSDAIQSTMAGLAKGFPSGVACVQDINNRGSVALEKATQGLLSALRADPRIQFAFTPFNASAPEFFVDIDRTKAEMLGVPVAAVHETLEAYLGSAYVNDFNLSGRTYQVIAQAEGLSRLDIEQISRLKAKSASGVMVPLGSIATFRTQGAPDRVPRYNLFPTAEIIGAAVPSVSSGSALDLVEEIAARSLPDGFTLEWTELSYQQRLAGGGIVIFLLSVVFVYLVLASQYESWSLPLAVILIVPMSLLSAIGGVMWMGQDNNILTQVGLVVLIGLAAKNAILIVEFARDLEAQGRSAVEAVVEASRLRLRPILMTSLAFILGVVPLMVAQGAGAELRHAIGTTVFFGMLGVTIFGLFFTPVFYVALRSLVLGTWRRPAGANVAPG